MVLSYQQIKYAKDKASGICVTHACNTFAGKMKENEGRIIGLSIYLYKQGTSRRRKLLQGVK